MDQEALLVKDSNVSRERSGLKKRAPPSGSYMSSPSAVPRPMYMKKDSSENMGVTVSNGIPTPSTTPPPPTTAAVTTPHPLASPSKPGATFKADVDDGDSPKALPTEPAEKPKLEELKELTLNPKKDQSEDTEDESKGRELDIYAEAVLACE